MITYLWIALGGALGSVARYGCSSLIAGWFGETFPWGTLIINVVGSLVIGFFATLTGPDGRVLVGPGRAAVRDGRDLRRLHHLLVVQPADPEPGARRRHAGAPAATSSARSVLCLVGGLARPRGRHGAEPGAGA